MPPDSGPCELWRGMECSQAASCLWDTEAGINKNRHIHAASRIFFADFTFYFQNSPKTTLLPSSWTSSSILRHSAVAMVHLCFCHERSCELCGTKDKIEGRCRDRIFVCVVCYFWDHWSKAHTVSSKLSNAWLFIMRGVWFFISWIKKILTCEPCFTYFLHLCFPQLKRYFRTCLRQWFTSSSLATYSLIMFKLGGRQRETTKILMDN